MLELYCLINPLFNTINSIKVPIFLKLHEQCDVQIKHPNKNIFGGVFCILHPTKQLWLYWDRASV